MDIETYKRVTQSQKRSKGFAWQRLGYLFYRDISVHISYGLLRLFPTITPNFVSMCMLSVAILGAYLIVAEYSLWGIGFIFLSFILDKVDGEIARWRNMSSVRGMYLDELYHTVIPFITIFSFWFNHAYESGPKALLVLFTVAFLTLYRRHDRKLFIFISVKKGEQIKNKELIAPLEKPWVHHIMDILPFKIASIVERFDVLLFIMLGVTLVDNIFVNSYYLSSLYVYGLFSIVYALRWFIKNYFGELDARCQNMVSNGF